MLPRCGVCVALMVGFFLVLSCPPSMAAEPVPPKPTSIALTATRDDDNLAVRRILDEAVTVNLESPTVSDLVELVRGHKINVWVDTRSLDEQGISPAEATLPRLRAEGVSLSSILHHLLRQVDLNFLVQHGKLVITTETVAEENRSVRVYPVGDLALRRLPDGRLHNAMEELCGLIQNTVGPLSWQESGGNGRLSVLAASFVCTQTDAVHEQLACLLEAMRVVAARQASDAKTPLRAASARQSAAVAKFAALQSQRLNFNGTPCTLAEMIVQMSQKCGVPMALDAKALDEQGIANDMPLAAILPDVSPSEALDFMLSPLDLCHFVRDELVVVTTRSVFEDPMSLVTDVYPVADLVGLPGQGGWYDFDSLIDTIMNCVAPLNWEDAGGNGRISEFPLQGLLVVSQSPDTQAAIARLLNELRRLGAPPAEVASADKTPVRGSQKPVAGVMEPVKNPLSSRQQSVVPLVTSTYSFTSKEEAEQFAEKILGEAQSADLLHQGFSVRSVENHLFIHTTGTGHRLVQKALDQKKQLHGGGFN